MRITSHLDFELLHSDIRPAKVLIGSWQARLSQAQWTEDVARMTRDAKELAERWVIHNHRHKLAYDDNYVLNSMITLVCPNLDVERIPFAVLKAMLMEMYQLRDKLLRM